jgi:hypothetical protein
MSQITAGQAAAVRRLRLQGFHPLKIVLTGASATLDYPPGYRFYGRVHTGSPDNPECFTFLLTLLFA